jgi:hypothetical protein
MLRRPAQPAERAKARRRVFGEAKAAGWPPPGV